MQFAEMLVLSLILIGQQDECESADLANGARDEDDVRVQGSSLGGILVGSARST